MMEGELQQTLDKNKTAAFDAPADNKPKQQVQATTAITGDAPPKQVALAMERLSEAGRVIADIRLGADRLLEALLLAAAQSSSTDNNNNNRALNLILKEESSMQKHLRDLRSIGKQLEETGVLTESLRSRSYSWGLHMPLVCPDGAVVAYAWKRQLAGQAGASAVDRTRLALKAFSDQKRRFFPHLGDGSGPEPATKKTCGIVGSDGEELRGLKTVSEILSNLEKEVPGLRTFTHERLDWLKRAPLLPASPNEIFSESSEDRSFPSTNALRQRSAPVVNAERISIIEMLFPSVFRVVISLHPVGSLEPDAVAFFSCDEGGSYIHARGFSVHHVFRHITEHASMALQYFIGDENEHALHFLLAWICSYQTLFSKACSKCGRLLTMDQESALLLPPVIRPFRNFSIGKIFSQNSSTEGQTRDVTEAFHIGCLSEEM